MTSKFKEGIERHFYSFFEAENFKQEYSIQESNRNYVAEIYISTKAKLRFHRIEQKNEIGIDIAKPDAISLSEYDQHGKEIWHDSWKLAGSPDSGLSLEELLDKIPESFPSEEERLIELKEFLTEHFERIVTNLTDKTG